MIITVNRIGERRLLDEIEKYCIRKCIQITRINLLVIKLLQNDINYRTNTL